TGHYLFNVFDGITTGRFNVRVVPPNNWTVTTPNPVFAAITKGDDFVTVNFGNRHILGGTGSGGGGAAGNDAGSDPFLSGPTSVGVDLGNPDGGDQGLPPQGSPSQGNTIRQTSNGSDLVTPPVVRWSVRTPSTVKGFSLSTNDW